MTWVAVAIAGGAALSAGGSAMSAQQGASATHENRDLWLRNAQNQSQGIGRLLYGNQFGLTNDRPNEPGSWKGLYYQGGGAAAPGSLLGRLSSLGSWGEQQGQNILGSYNRDTSRLGGLASGAEGMARNWGAGRDAVIRGDFSRQLTNMNDQSRGALNATGFGNSTAVANQLSGNARDVGREQERALQTLSESQIDRQLGARTQRLNVEGGRASGQTGLLQSLLSQNLGLRQAPMNLEYQAQTSTLANPWANMTPGSLQTPQGSPLGGALSNLGGGATAYGGYSLGQQNMQSLLQQLQRSQSGGAGTGAGTGGFPSGAMY